MMINEPYYTNFMKLVERFEFRVFLLLDSYSLVCPTILSIHREKCEPIYPLLPLAGCNKRSNFKQNKAGLNSVFFLTGCLTEAKEPSQSYYLPISKRKTNEFMLS